MNQIQSLLLLYKKEGNTPLETLEEYKEQNPQYEGVPMTYAGRLDPMAGGLLLVLTGEECKEKQKYLNLEKEYETEILFGISTDTADCLGIVKEVQEKKLGEAEIKNAISEEIGKSQHYPAYSSKTFEGKSLWQWAREGIFKKIKSPGKITKAEIVFSRTIEAQELLKQVEERISKVKGDFRQKEILESWEKNLQGSDFNFLVIKCVLSATSGAYVRVFAENAGKNAHLPTLAWSIKRTKIGDFTLKNSVIV